MPNFLKAFSLFWGGGEREIFGNTEAKYATYFLCFNVLDLRCPSNLLGKSLVPAHFLSLKVFRGKILLSVFNGAINLRCRSKRKMTQEADGDACPGTQREELRLRDEGYVSRIPVSQNRA